jgi:branched-chain amino acid transport system permease protein
MTDRTDRTDRSGPDGGARDASDDAGVPETDANASADTGSDGRADPADRADSVDRTDPGDPAVDAADPSGRDRFDPSTDGGERTDDRAAVDRTEGPRGVAGDRGAFSDRSRRWLSVLGRYRVPLGLVALVLFLRPLVAQPWALGFGQIATTMLIWMLFVASFNLLFGFTGLLSFGHAMFFGFGMYAVAIGLSRFSLSLPVAALAGIAFSSIFGYLLGRLIVNKGEIYFAMLTLAVAQAVYFVANQNPYGLTGGSNGITGTLPPWIETYRGETAVSLDAFAVDWYWAVAAVFLVCALGLWQVLRSPFGRSLIAIRENEPLARAMGVDAERYKVASFTMSGVLAAIAGVLLAINDQGAALETFGVLTSGDAVLMAVLGGVNYFFGPFAGAFVWLFAEDYLTDFEVLYLPLREFALVSVDLSGLLEYWRFLLGGLFVVVVLLSPKNGIWGFLHDTIGRAADRLRGWRG